MERLVNPVLVESADTGPFFHNNSIETIEGAVDFYNSKAFNEAPGFGAAIAGIRLEATEVVAVAAFLRVINVLENERSARDLINRIKIAIRGEGLELATSHCRDRRCDRISGGGASRPRRSSSKPRHVKRRASINRSSELMRQQALVSHPARADCDRRCAGKAVQCVPVVR